MDLHNAFVRARRGFREDAKLHGVAVSSLIVAFLCLGAALLATTNLSRIADRWRGSGRMTIYVASGAPAADVERLRGAIEDLPEVRDAELVSSASARDAFLRDAQLSVEANALPQEIFPDTIEVALVPGVSRGNVEAMATRLGNLSTVEDVETFHSFFERLDALLFAGRVLAFALGALVLFCVLAVVSNTIRLAVTSRRDEVQVLKLCGATDSFVRSPFIVEGALQGVTAALIALAILFGGFLGVRSYVDGTFSSFTGLHTVFLHPALALGLVVVGALGGMVGSVLSLRRHLEV